VCSVINRQTLTDGWTLTSIGGPVPAAIAGRTLLAEVPGSAHTDLLAAGLIEDPYLDRVEQDLSWAHRASWRYELALAAAAPDPDERVDLVFDGLDTVATIALGGARLGRTANMHRSYRFDVRSHLTGAAAPLTVDLASALAYADGLQLRVGLGP